MNATEYVGWRKTFVHFQEYKDKKLDHPDDDKNINPPVDEYEYWLQEWKDRKAKLEEAKLVEQFAKNKFFEIAGTRLDAGEIFEMEFSSADTWHKTHFGD